MRKGAIVAVVVVGVAGLAGGGYFARAQHLGKLEGQWAAVSASEAGYAERIAACERFLSEFPADHPFGNPRAKDAARLVADLRAGLADELELQEEERRRLAAEKEAEAARLAEAEALAKAAAAALPVREKVLDVLRDRLFALWGEAVDIGRGSVFLHLENRGVHEVGFGIVERGPAPDAFGARLLAPEAVAEALGRAVYDAKARRVDKDALRVFLAAAYVGPDEPVLGMTAKAIYPAFRRRVRNELRLYRGATRQLGAPLADLKAEWLEGAPAASEAGRDWRPFYKSLAERTDSLRAFGIGPCEVRDADLGFWIRRIDDGTAPLLGAFLEKLVREYDAEWLAALGDKPQPFAATSGWAGADPAQLVKKGASYVIEDGGETVDPCTRQFRADPPEKKPAVFDDAKTGDRLVRREALGGGWASEANGLVAFSADSKQLLVTGPDKLYWVDLATLQEARSAALSKGNGRSPRVVAGRAAIVRPVEEGGTEILDARSGGVLARFEGFVATDFDAGPTVMARLVRGANEASGRLEVRYRTGDSGWATTNISLPAERFEEVKVHPSGEVVFVRQASARAPDRTGFKAWDVGSGERRGDLDLPEVDRFSFSPNGARLCRPAPGKAEVMLEWIDVAEGHRAPDPKKRWPGKDCRFVTGERLLVQSEQAGSPHVLQLFDVASGNPVGRPVNAGWDLETAFRDLSPDGRTLLLQDPNRHALSFWSLAEPAASPKPSP